MSYHNLRAFGSVGSLSEPFATWLQPGGLLIRDRSAQRSAAALAPGARHAHPREEHLLPLMVAAGAAGDDVGYRIFHDRPMGVNGSVFQFGTAPGSA